MKKKQLSLLLAAASLSIVCAAPALATETGSVSADAAVESTAEQDTEAPDAIAGSEEETEAATEAETEVSDFVEGSAVLDDYSYEKGELTEEGWNSSFLNMSYVPGKDISMGIAENDQLATYYERNGKDKQVAANEMVAVDSKEGYVQMMVEVNPNKESAEDILGRFSKNEKLTLVSDPSEMEIAGKNFLTCTGVVDKDRFLIGVSVDEDDFVVAVKVKYANTVARKALLDGFDAMNPETEAETADAETETEAAAAEEEDNISMPADFEDGEVFEAEETDVVVVE